ncbi:MAG: LysR substrate-binding domain-containing protein [Acetobacterales bacterium]
MTLRELRYLVALADHGHFGRAARACHVSQPTLSTQVRKLEAFLGVALVERTARGPQLTPVGARVVARARQALAEADAIVALAQQAAAPLSGPLSLGVIPTLGPYLLPWLVPALRRAWPALQLAVHEDLTARLAERLADHHLDAALVALPLDEMPDAGVEPLFDEPFFLAMPPDHRLARLARVREADLDSLRADDRLLLLAEGHCLRDQALAACRRVEAPGMPEGGDFRAASLETIRQMVAAGMGCTLLPALALGGAPCGPAAYEERGAALATRPIEAAGASRRIGLAWRRSYPRADDLRRLAETIRAALPRGVTAVVGDS